MAMSFSTGVPKAHQEFTAKLYAIAQQMFVATDFAKGPDLYVTQHIASALGVGIKGYLYGSNEEDVIEFSRPTNWAWHLYATIAPGWMKRRWKPRVHTVRLTSHMIFGRLAEKVGPMPSHIGNRITIPVISETGSVRSSTLWFRKPTPEEYFHLCSELCLSPRAVRKLFDRLYHLPADQEVIR